MKLGLFPGCSFESSSYGYSLSLKAVARELGLELEEIEGWNCCGASTADKVDSTLALALPARILAQAEKQEFAEILTPCARCFQRLCGTRNDLAFDNELLGLISEVIELKYTGSTRIRNILEVLDQLLTPAVRANLKSDFPHTAACYYGCILARPPKVITTGDPVQPVVMETLLGHIGATTVEWGRKSECCGKSMTLSTDMIKRLSRVIISDAAAHGADVIITACPACHANLEACMGDVRLPVLHITQAIGMALGIGKKELGLKEDFCIPARSDVPEDRNASGEQRDAAGIN